MASSELIIRKSEPLNAETPLSSLRASFRTPQELFYIRTHGTAPEIVAANYRLSVGGQVSHEQAYSLDDLRSRFAAKTLDAVMQCAGNRRADLARVRPVNGEPWEAGAIGNAAWKGVQLADILRAAGCSADAPLHIEFVSCDEVEMKGERFPYTVSIPIAKAMSSEVLLVWEMNGSPLTREHGNPLRVVVGGYAGVRSVKWLSRINVIDAPSTGYMQQRDYKFFPPTSTEDNADWQHAITINNLPLNAAICEPEPHARLSTGPLTVRGYAIATANSTIARVDVSQDGGRTWRQADLESHIESPWSWTPWQITLDLAVGEHELAVRAWDDAGQTQPALPDDTWNFKGYLSASWHRIPVIVGP